MNRSLFVAEARNLTPTLSGNGEHGVCRIIVKIEQSSHKKRGVPLSHRNFQNQRPSATIRCLRLACPCFCLHAGYTLSHWALAS